jgi:hypothetical protein
MRYCAYKKWERQSDCLCIASEISAKLICAFLTNKKFERT